MYDVSECWAFEDVCIRFAGCAAVDTVVVVGPSYAEFSSLGPASSRGYVHADAFVLFAVYVFPYLGEHIDIDLVYGARGRSVRHGSSAVSMGNGGNVRVQVMVGCVDERDARLVGDVYAEVGVKLPSKVGNGGIEDADGSMYGVAVCNFVEDGLHGVVQHRFFVP